MAFFSQGKLHSEMIDTSRGYLAPGSGIFFRRDGGPPERVIVALAKASGGVLGIEASRLLYAKRFSVRYRLERGNGKR